MGSQADVGVFVVLFGVHCRPTEVRLRRLGTRGGCFICKPARAPAAPPNAPLPSHWFRQVYDYEYDLILRPDINTRGHTQWFYFSVSNTLRNVPYKLNIINMVKSDSLYQDGMQPLICSEKESVATGRVWTRNGTNTSYYQARARLRISLSVYAKRRRPTAYESRDGLYFVRMPTVQKTIPMVMSRYALLGSYDLCLEFVRGF